VRMQVLTDGKRYTIFNGDNGFIIATAPPGLVGTASALRDAVRNRLPTFYWFPSVVNFPGIDGIFVDGEKIYLLQATIADTHRRPDARLKKAWKAIGAASAQLYNWHFVMVTDKKGLAEIQKYVRELGPHLPGVFLGVNRHEVPVWGCFLRVGSDNRVVSESRSSGPPYFTESRHIITRTGHNTSPYPTPAHTSW